MQTFLPYQSFKQSALVLDDKRLNKQITEAFQIRSYLKLIDSKGHYKHDGKIPGWVHHPACLMWKGYEKALDAYIAACIVEWLERGKNNNRWLPGIPRKLSVYKSLEDDCVKPIWLGKTLCNTHRSNLLRKLPSYYKQFKWKVSDDIPYYWPFIWGQVGLLHLPLKVFQAISKEGDVLYKKKLKIIKKGGVVSL